MKTKRQLLIDYPIIRIIFIQAYAEMKVLRELAASSFLGNKGWFKDIGKRIVALYSVTCNLFTSYSFHACLGY